MNHSGSNSLRVSLSKKRKVTAKEEKDLATTTDLSRAFVNNKSRPLIFYYEKHRENFDEAACFHLLLDTKQAGAPEATQLLHRIAVAKTRGTVIEEYFFSKEKIAWLGGHTNDTFLKLFFSFCRDSSTSRSALTYIQGILKSYKYARLLLHKSSNDEQPRSNIEKVINPDSPHQPKALIEYMLESNDFNTLESLYLNTELCSEGCFPVSPATRNPTNTPGDVYYLSIAPNKGAFVKQLCMQKLNIRLRCEYAFQTDVSTSNIHGFQLHKPQMLRDYQNEAIESVFCDGRICSGLIVLPCGAGKTLTGISIASRVSKRLLILCVNTFSVYQWRDQLLRWSTIEPSKISIITASLREHPADIIITTYAMLTMDDERRNDQSKELVNTLLLEPFGLVLLDEVHMAAAKNFRKVVSIVTSHCFLGLTATLLREDDKIDDLDYLIGPLLYECSMYTLKKAGSIADVVCAEVYCPFPNGYLLQYLHTQGELDRRKLYNMNPTKIWCCQALIHYHETRSPPDKTLVFVDSIVMLELCARLFRRPMIHGQTNDFERDCILSWFKYSSTVNTIFISRIGDSALDIPETNVIIQLSSLFGSQRTEVQRIGRIQRVKSACREAFFYSLVTPDTREVTFSNRRKQFLLGEGYGYNVLQASEITREIFCNNNPNGNLCESILPICVGIPFWGFRTFSDEIMPITTQDALNVECSIRHGRNSLNIHGVNHSITQATETKMPYLSERIFMGPLVRLGSHEGCCREECLKILLRYIHSDRRDYIEYIAETQNVVLEAINYNPNRAKIVEKTIKAETQSSILKKRDKAIHQFRKKLARDTLKKGH